MGRDKARLLFRGQPMVKTAVDTLTVVCEHVSIAGNRTDLEAFAPVVRETREDVGPLAGIEAGLLSCRTEWALFIPVDVPLLQPSFLHMWAEAVLAHPNTRASYIHHGTDPHPAICMLRRDCAGRISQCIDDGERRLQSAFAVLEGLWIADAESFGSQKECDRWLKNINTLQELELAEEALLHEKGIMFSGAK